MDKPINGLIRKGALWLETIFPFLRESRAQKGIYLEPLSGLKRSIYGVWTRASGPACVTAVAPTVKVDALRGGEELEGERQCRGAKHH